MYANLLKKNSMSRNTVKSRNHKHDFQAHKNIIIKMQKGSTKNSGRALFLSTVVATGFSLFEPAASASGESLRPSTPSRTESSSANSTEDDDAAEAFAQHRSRMLELLGTEGKIRGKTLDFI